MDNGEAHELRYQSNIFLSEIGLFNGSVNSIASINNSPTLKGYKQKDIKARVIKCLKDLVKAGYPNLSRT